MCKIDYSKLQFGAPLKTVYGNKVFFLHTLDDGSVSCLVGDARNYGFSILEADEIESIWPVDEARLTAVLDEAESLCLSAGTASSVGWHWRKWAEWGYRKACEYILSKRLI